MDILSQLPLLLQLVGLGELAGPIGSVANIVGSVAGLVGGEGSLSGLS